MITTKRTKITKKGISRKAAKGAKKNYGYLLGPNDWNDWNHLNGWNRLFVKNVEP